MYMFVADICTEARAVFRYRLEQWEMFFAFRRLKAQQLRHSGMGLLFCASHIFLMGRLIGRWLDFAKSKCNWDCAAQRIVTEIGDVALRGCVSVDYDYDDFDGFTGLWVYQQLIWLQLVEMTVHTGCTALLLGMHFCSWRIWQVH